MHVLPAVVRAEYRGEYKVRVVFIDGGTITWPNGADIAPETLHERAKAAEAA